MADYTLLSLVVAVIALAVSGLGLPPLYQDYFRRRRERLPPVTVEVFNESIKVPLESEWTIRVRSVENTLLEHCKVQYAGRDIHTIVGGKGVWEAMLTKGGGLNFRIPAVVPIADDSWVVVLDGDRVIRKDQLGTLPHTTP